MKRILGFLSAANTGEKIARNSKTTDANCLGADANCLGDRGIMVI
jgi:hypothetical protein